jgi:hypothetical protein
LRQPLEVFLNLAQARADFGGTGVVLHFSANNSTSRFFEKIIFGFATDACKMHRYLSTLPLDIPPYLHHILVILMLFDDYWE